ncbi:hypothetical protein Dda_0097 [Drechslerella dactyloides]|uniref:F-box domain-containing protein n=1 Tax=Drechslerella dactyloides TaxID=74499 RepID=A0AAD6J447_DREDA|nr:hypothetical protein Dda_0097 [Drechslerella dactyloides]
MPGISSLPLEVLFLVTGYLYADDIKALRLTCRDLNGKTAEAHVEELFKCRTYFATVQDLQALLEFTRHPSKAALRLKHLRLDIASPYIHIQPRQLLDSLHNGEDGEPLRPPKLFSQTCFAVECHNYEGVEQSEDQALVFAAIQNLPNLEIVEFVDRTGAPSDKSLKIHYNTLMTPEFKDEFIEFYKEHQIRQKRGRMTSLFLYVMVALKYSQCRLKEILVDNPRHSYMFMSHGWFENHRRHVKDLKTPLDTLRVLELNLAHPAAEQPDYLDFDEVLETSEVQLKCLPSFLTKATPNIETLKLRFEEIADVYNTRTWVGKYRAYEPNLLLREVELNLPRLKRLELRAIPFIKEELLEVLLRPHSATLRHLVLEDCVLQELPQTWSALFELLDDPLHLETFSFWTKSIDVAINLTGRIPHLFRVWGDVRKDGHICQVQVLKKKEIVNTDFKTGLRLIHEFEERLNNIPSFGQGPYEDDGGDDDEDLLETDDEEDPADFWHFPHDDDWIDMDEDHEDDSDEDPTSLGIPQFPLPIPPFPLPMPPILPSQGAQSVFPHQTYSAQLPENTILPIPQPANVDNTGHLLGINMVPQPLPHGSVLMPPFLIPRSCLNTGALQGQRLSVQNVLRNLTSTALDTGIQNGQAGPSTANGSGEQPGAEQSDVSAAPAAQTLAAEPADAAPAGPDEDDDLVGSDLNGGEAGSSSG